MNWIMHQRMKSSSNHHHHHSSSSLEIMFIEVMKKRNVWTAHEMSHAHSLMSRITHSINLESSITSEGLVWEMHHEMPNKCNNEYQKFVSTPGKCSLITVTTTENNVITNSSLQCSMPTHHSSHQFGSPKNCWGCSVWVLAQTSPKNDHSSLINELNEHNVTAWVPTTRMRNITHHNNTGVWEGMSLTSISQ